VLRHLVVVPGIGAGVLTAPDGRSAWDVTVRALTHVLIDSGAVALRGVGAGKIINRG
jgi:hypothetical protein